MFDYNLLREFADSWGLLMLIILFLAVVIFAFRPGSAKHHEKMARLPLHHETAPDSKPDRNRVSK